MKKPKTEYKTIVICFHTDCKFNKQQDTFYICSKKQIHLLAHYSSDHRECGFAMVCEDRKVKKEYYDDTKEW